ncbi:MAG: hypothetical protein GY754_28550 [bacterium]|nr:hypothetical protein [bacterium]
MRTIFVILLCMMLSVSAFSDESVPVKKVEEFNKTFFRSLLSVSPIQRDLFWKERLNTIIAGKGVVLSIEKMKRYKKNYRVVLRDKNAYRYNLGIKYYIFVEKEESIALLVKDEVFEFKGQVMAYTPVNTRRNEYIIDILFEEGAISIE